MKTKLSAKGEKILDAGSVQVGRFRLWPWTEKHIYIQDDSTEEAGEFEIKKLEKVIKRFFGREF